jgi:hypothetical protein
MDRQTEEPIVIQPFYGDLSTAEFIWHENRSGAMGINDMMNWKGCGRKRLLKHDINF